MDNKRWIYCITVFGFCAFFFFAIGHVIGHESSYQKGLKIGKEKTLEAIIPDIWRYYFNPVPPRQEQYQGILTITCPKKIPEENTMTGRTHHLEISFTPKK